jgi:hypothetical protein
MAQEPQEYQDALASSHGDLFSPPAQHAQPEISPINRELLEKLEKLGAIEIGTGGKIVVHVPGEEETASPHQQTEPYLEQVLALFQRFEQEASWRRRAHSALQLFLFLAAAAATMLLGLSRQLLPALLTGLVTIVTVVTAFARFGEQAHTWEWMAEELANEYQRFQTREGFYRDRPTGETFVLFLDRVESLAGEKAQRHQARKRFKREHLHS